LKVVEKTITDVRQPTEKLQTDLTQATAKSVIEKSQNATL